MRQSYRTSERGVGGLTGAGLARAALTAMLMLAGGLCVAQYRAVVTANVDTVLKAGIYRIVLPPSFVARCRTDLSDLRIFDEAGKEAPYVLRTNSSDRFNAGLLALPDPKIIRKDSSDHHSYYYLHYNDRYRIDRLSLVVASPALYKRTAFVLPVGEGSIGITASVSIDPADTVIRLTPMKADSLLIDVDNEDNAPLAITRVASAQSGIYLLTYVEPGHSYRLMAGDPGVVAPEYDLHYFADSIQAPVTIGLGPVRRPAFKVIAATAMGKEAGKRSGFVWLWVLIGAVVVLLLYVSVKLTHAVDQKKEVE